MLTDLQDRLKEASPNNFDSINKGYFDTGCVVPLAKLESLWTSVRNIYNAAMKCEVSKKDENAWVRVVEKVLDTAILYSNLEMLEVNSM